MARSAKLSDLKKRLDKIDVVRGTFKRFKILSVDSGRGWHSRSRGPKIVEHEVTSVVHGILCWITNLDDKSRRKERISSGFYADTDKNRSILSEVVDLNKRIVLIEGQIQTKLASAAVAYVPAGSPTEEG